MNRTIAAQSTPPGEGAISLVRISGPNAHEIVEKISSKKIKNIPSHTACYTKILAKDKTAIDSVIALVMKGPKTYTGEDVVEISCHGSPLIVRKILERLFEEGAKPARPGEFSLQAFLNGKLDLAQAEAVQQLISSKSEKAAENAEKQLSGKLSIKIKSFQTELTSIAAILEAWVDFPEEDLAFSPFEEIIKRLEINVGEMETLSNTFHEGRILQEGVSLCLIGAPNVGKSSLMNALLGFDRAIVTPIAGTTRDLIEEDLQLFGLNFRIIDTAGIRSTSEIIEQEGIRRSKLKIAEADLILFLLDSSRDVSVEDLHIMDSIPKAKTVLIWNKTDLKTPKFLPEFKHQVAVSAKLGIGLEDLKKEVQTILYCGIVPSKDEVAITKLRHKTAIDEAILSIKKVIEGLKNRVSAEFVSSDMRLALEELSSILGTNVTEDILTSIFSQFCLGK
jgi:tRNA modification GTPase